MHPMFWPAFAIAEQIRINEMFSCFIAHHDKTFEFPGETHNFWECVCVLEGSICVSADERIYNLSAGNIIFHKPMELHKFHVTENRDAYLFIFSFSAQGPLCKYFRDKVFTLSDEQQSMLTQMIQYMDKKLTQLNITVERNREDQYLQPFSKIPTYSQTVLTYLYQFMLSLADDSKIMCVSQSQDSLIFAQAVSYMNSRICDNPSVDEIADYVSLSATGLKRIFKYYTGMGVHKYFLMLKLKAATEMLSGGMPVTEVAQTLGFSSQGYFTNVFKRELGILPSSLY